MQLHPRSTDCPTNQQFYVCFSPAFSGCCSSDPCLNSGTCPDSSSSTTTQTPKTISANNNRLTRDPTLWMIPPTSTPTPTPTTAMTSAAAKTGMLVGGIIGGVAIVVAAVGLWYLFWLGRRGRGRGGKKGKESDEVPLKPTHTRSSSAGRGSVYSTAASAYDPVPLGDEGWKSMPSPPPPPLTYTPQRWEGGQWGEEEQQPQCAELPTAMLEPVELSASEAETPGSPFLEKRFRFGKSLDGGVFERWNAGGKGKE